MDAAGGIANFSFAKQLKSDSYQVDARVSAKLIEVPDALIHGTAATTVSTIANLEGFTIRPVLGGSVKGEWRIPFEYESGDPA
jgi:hypothetical protein